MLFRSRNKNMNTRHLNKVRLWLTSLIVMIIVMIIIGGITRLTHSGLSMVEWKPLMGSIPPLTDTDWQTVFEKYKQFPEYQTRNKGMSLPEFKKIFFWEYLHRLWGRLMGIVLLLPFLFFYKNNYFDAKLKFRTLVIFGLGMLQGLAGWYMVKSGLSDIPEVSHFRLALHLGLALLILGYIFWTLLDLNSEKSVHSNRIKGSSLYYKVHLLFGLLIIQILYGAFTAGLKAGFMMNTFPKMGDSWLPPVPIKLFLSLNGILSNAFVVQFIHRWLGLGSILFTLFIVFSAYKNYKLKPTQKAAINTLLGLMTCQFLLGILTLLKAVPLFLGVAHQFIAVLLFLSLIYTVYTFRSN